MRLSLQLETLKKAWVRDEPTMEERSLWQISQNWTLRWTRSCEPSLSPRKHIAVKVEQSASSQCRCVRWRKKVVADPLRAHGSWTQQSARFLRTGTTRDLGRQQRTQVTDSLFLTLHHFLRPFYKAPPTCWLNYDWRARRAMNERSNRFRGISRSWLDETSGMRRDSKTDLVPSVCRQKKTRCYLHTKPLIYRPVSGSFKQKGFKMLTEKL